MTIERIEDLILHLPLLEHAGGLDQAIGQGGFPVVDVRDDAEVADVIELDSGQSRLYEAGNWL